MIYFKHFYIMYIKLVEIWSFTIVRQFDAILIFIILMMIYCFIATNLRQKIRFFLQFSFKFYYIYFIELYYI